MVRFQVDEARCTQCGECAADCPGNAISMNGYPVMSSEERCFQCQHCLAICPTGAVSILGLDPDASIQLAGNLPEPDRLATLIKGRRTVRRYTGRDLAPELIDELLAVACHAPTGVNRQAVLFSVIREGAVMETLRSEVMAKLVGLKEKLPAGYLTYAVQAWQENGRDIIFRGAPHLLVTSAAKHAICPAQDCLIAMTTFQLMAHARGVGTVWDGMFMAVLSLFPELLSRLGIPEDHLLGYAMAFGEPAVEYHRTVQRGPAMVNFVRS